MKKIWFGFVACMLGSSLIYGYDAEFRHATVFDPVDPTAVASESYYVAPDDVAPDRFSGLTPRRPQTAPLAQHVPVSVPVLMPTHQSESPRLPAPPVAAFALRTEVPVVQQAPINNGGFDPHVYAELDRLNSAIQQLQRETAPPDTRRGFSAPRMNGRMFFDTWMISQPDRCEGCPNIRNKAGLREFRLGITGTGYNAFDYRVELMLADGSGEVNFADMWIGASNVPLLGYLRAGHYNLETGIGYMTGTIQTTGTKFLGPAPAFTLGRRFGISSAHLFAQDRIRWVGGFFQGQPTHNIRSRHVDSQGYILNTRLTMVPYYAAGGRNFLHFGGHYSYVVARPSHPGITHPGITIHTGGSGWGLGETIRTGAIQGRHHHRSGLELAYQRGSFGVKSEAFFAKYGAADNNRMARGASLELSYFLTGEHRAYNFANGVVGAVQMNRPFQPFRSGGWNLVRGPGAWQIYMQYSYVDLTDWRGVSVPASGTQPIGGYQHDVTLGVNWFWTSNLRWIFEYTHSQQNTGTDRKYCYQDILGASVRINW